MNKKISDQFNISEPMTHHFVLMVKGVKFTTSLKELYFLYDLLYLFLKSYDQETEMPKKRLQE